MVTPNYFKAWISGQRIWVLLPLLFILFTGMAQFASFALIQIHVISYYGVQSEDVSLAFQMTYVGILATLPLQFRLLNRFDTRNYLLVALLLGILLNLGCAFTGSFFVFTILRFLIGITTCMIAGCMLITIFSVLPKDKGMLIGVSFFFGTILSIGILVGTMAAWVVERMDWQSLYYFLILLQTISIIVCLVIFNQRTHSKKIPLFQFDLLSAILFVGFGISIAYTMIYGPRYYWFDTSEIRISFVLSMLFIGMFVAHQKRLKRPSIDLRSLRFGKFWFGLLLLIVFYGIKDTINLLYGYAAGVLGWSSSDIVSLGLFNVCGVVLGTFLAVRALLHNKQHLPKLLLVGFGLLLFYHLWVYRNLTEDLSYMDLILPIGIQGLASGLLFAPIIVLCMASLPSFTGMTGIVICAYARFFASLNSIAGFYTLQENFKEEFRIGYLKNITTFNLTLNEQLHLYQNLLVSQGFGPGEAIGIARGMVGRSIGIHGMLLTYRAIFMLSVYLLLFTIAVLILFAVLNKIRSKGKPAKLDAAVNG